MKQSNRLLERQKLEMMVRVGRRKELARMGLRKGLIMAAKMKKFGTAQNLTIQPSKAMSLDIGSTWTPMPGALVTVHLNKNGTKRRTAMVVDIWGTNFVLVELIGNGFRKDEPELRLVHQERVVRRQPDMFSLGSDALLWHRGDKGA